jgi:hypothetical protein
MIGRENYPGITVCARTYSIYRGSEDAAGQDDRISILHENEAQNSGPEHSCMELRGAKN